MRQPLRLTATIGVISKSAFKPTSTAIRSFHQARPAANFFSSRTFKPSSTLGRVRNAFKQSRGYQQEAAPIPQSASLVQKLVVGGAMFGGTLLVRKFSMVLMTAN